MTNAQIIFEQSQKLAEDGKIQYTGRVFKGHAADGAEVEIKETEPIHTFAEWKKAGFIVKKGQHAVAKFTIWMFTDKPTKAAQEAAETAGKEPDADPHYYMKTAAFFSASQVEKITA